jgi:tRNA (Thr-GGU) A37 N-methylase
VTAVTLLRREKNRLVVRGLDAINGTPVVDVKPYVPQFDAVESPRVPAWIDELMKGYF